VLKRDEIAVDPPPPPGYAGLEIGKVMTTGASNTLRPAGRLLTRRIFDLALGAGREMPRVHADSLHKVAYGIAGAPSSCVIFAAFERLDVHAKEIMLRRDRNS
jgi:hypothetical protein